VKPIMEFHIKGWLLKPEVSDSDKFCSLLLHGRKKFYNTFTWLAVMWTNRRRVLIFAKSGTKIIKLFTSIIEQYS